MSEPPTPDGDLFHEETDDPLLADRRNFFKVELWTRYGLQIERCCLRATAWISARGVRRLHQETAACPADDPATNSGAAAVPPGACPNGQVFASLIMDLIGRWMLHRPFVLLGFMSADQTARSRP